jgi:selT/selW/selH-like putative selenoprotein
MRGNYVKVAEFLANSFPELQGRIVGANYPVPPIVDLLATLVSFLQLAGLVWMVMGGESVLRLVGYRNQLPSFYYTIQKYGIQIGIFMFLILPQIVGKWKITGAFEIYLDGDQEIFSKLATGGFPKVRETVSEATYRRGCSFFKSSHSIISFFLLVRGPTLSTFWCRRVYRRVGKTCVVLYCSRNSLGVYSFWAE